MNSTQIYFYNFFGFCMNSYYGIQNQLFVKCMILFVSEKKKLLTFKNNA